MWRSEKLGEEESLGKYKKRQNGRKKKFKKSNFRDGVRFGSYVVAVSFDSDDVFPAG